MQFHLQAYLNYTLVLMTLVAGLVVGLLGGRIVHFFYGGVEMFQPLSTLQPLAVRHVQEDDLQLIINRSLFDAASIGARFVRPDVADIALESELAVIPARIDNLTLLGTVVAGENSLALIHTGTKVEVFALGREVTAGVTVETIERRRVVLLDRGERHELLLVEEQSTDLRRAESRPAAAASASTTATGVVALGDGRFRVDRGMVDNARANMGALLQSARMIPQLENEQTVGFRLVGMQRGSLLEQLGLRLGDIVVEINQVKLDSPEKALQIFQQVREANNISVGFIRNGQPQTFEYSLE